LRAERAGNSNGRIYSIDITCTNDTNKLSTTKTVKVVVVHDQGMFVRRHFLDFLGREPDQSGWGFWTNQITSCGDDLQCTEVRRIDVSASFFFSIEFQNNGYLVERFTKSPTATRMEIQPLAEPISSQCRQSVSMNSNRIHNGLVGASGFGSWLGTNAGE
jgi:hypothetical protein